jgi:hypothetical protein
LKAELRSDVGYVQLQTFANDLSGRIGSGCANVHQGSGEKSAEGLTARTLTGTQFIGTQPAGKCIQGVGHPLRKHGKLTGYLNRRVPGREVPQLVHRIAWEAVHGAIPDGLTIDHLCRNPSCVNVAHMEVVTQRENNLRGDTIPGRNARKTHCKRGHPFNEKNTYRHMGPHGPKRQCRACRPVYRPRRKVDFAAAIAHRAQKQRELAREAAGRYDGLPDGTDAA